MNEFYVSAHSDEDRRYCDDVLGLATGQYETELDQRILEHARDVGMEHAYEHDSIEQLATTMKYLSIPASPSYFSSPRGPTGMRVRPGSALSRSTQSTSQSQNTTGSNSKSTHTFDSNSKSNSDSNGNSNSKSRDQPQPQQLPRRALSLHDYDMLLAAVHMSPKNIPLSHQIHADRSKPSLRAFSRIRSLSTKRKSTMPSTASGAASEYPICPHCPVERQQVPTYRLPCGHVYCTPKLRSIIKRAMEITIGNAMWLPPSCCNMGISGRIVGEVLSDRDRAKFLSSLAAIAGWQEDLDSHDQGQSEESSAYASGGGTSQPNTPAESSLDIANVDPEELNSNLQRAMELPDFRALRKRQEVERDRFLSYQNRQRQLILRRRDELCQSAAKSHDLARETLEDEQVNVITKLEDKHVHDEAKLRQSHESEARACTIKLKHMEAYFRQANASPSGNASITSKDGKDGTAKSFDIASIADSASSTSGNNASSKPTTIDSKDAISVNKDIASDTKDAAADSKDSTEEHKDPEELLPTLPIPHVQEAQQDENQQDEADVKSNSDGGESDKNSFESAPVHTITPSDVRELQKQYWLRDNMSQKHEAAINILRNTQSRAVMNRQYQQERDLERLEDDQRGEMEQIDNNTQNALCALKNTMDERRNRLTSRWAIQEGIWRRQLEQRTGIAWTEPIASVEWPMDDDLPTLNPGVVTSATTSSPLPISIGEASFLVDHSGSDSSAEWPVRPRRRSKEDYFTSTPYTHSYNLSQSHSNSERSRSRGTRNTHSRSPPSRDPTERKDSQQTITPGTMKVTSPPMSPTRIGINNVAASFVEGTGNSHRESRIMNRPTGRRKVIGAPSEAGGITQGITLTGRSR